MNAVLSYCMVQYISVRELWIDIDEMFMWLF
jgi:hypothetical protein